MVRPISLRPEDTEVIRAPPAAYVYRAAAAHLRSFVTGATPASAARSMFGNDIVTDIVLRAASQLAAVPRFGRCRRHSGHAASGAGVSI